ncbi:hypothetical protein ABEX38_30075 [Priestia megaterium]
MYVPTIGDRVFVDTFLFRGFAEVTYIDFPNLYVHELQPIQVTMENPDIHGQTYKRVNLTEIKLK